MRVERSSWRIGAHAGLAVMSFLCVVPFILLITSSLMDDKSVVVNGYSFIPTPFSVSAYSYLLTQAREIGRAYLITVSVTTVGTVSGLLITSMLAYPLSRPDFRLGNKLSFVVFFTLLFNGGLVPTYLVYTQLLHIKNTLFALLVPGLLMNGFSVLLMRTYFRTSIPLSILEAARIDGAGEVRTFFTIVAPLSLPIFGTIGLFQAIAYWNDWFNGLIYLNDPKLFSVQVILNRILTDIQYLSSMASMGSGAAAAASQIPGTTVRMAIAVVGAIPLFLAYPFFQKYLVKGIAVGSIKG